MAARFPRTWTAALGAGVAGLLGFGVGRVTAPQQPRPKPAAPLPRPDMPPAAAPKGKPAATKPAVPVVPAGPVMHDMPIYGPPVSENLQVTEGFVLSFDRRLRLPRFVYQHLTPDTSAAKVASRVKEEFHEDPLTPPLWRASMDSFKGSGYDRGHMAPAADMKQSQSMMRASFSLSNIAPQHPQLNREYWARLERAIRMLTTEFPHVHVFTGPLFLPHQRGKKWWTEYEVLGDPPTVAVPTHFFKVVLTQDVEGKEMVAAFIVPNHAVPADTPLEQFAVPLAQVEASTGFALFPKRPPSLPAALPLCSQPGRCTLPPPGFWLKGETAALPASGASGASSASSASDASGASDASAVSGASGASAVSS